MASGIFSVGSTGLLAAQAGLVTTGHNIANVNTPGYSRQEVGQSSLPGIATGAGFFGQGTQVDTVRRIYDAFLAGEMRQSQSSSSYQEARNTSLTRIDELLGDASTSLAPALEGFYAGLNTVAANPADLSSRQSLLSSAQALASRFHLAAEQLAQVRDGLATQVESSVRSINAYATQIGVLNRSIAQAHVGSGTVQPPNDLLDQRDQLLLEMSRLIGTASVQQDDGSLNVFLANGQGLVIGEQVYTLQVGNSPTDPQEITVGLKSPGGFVPFRTQDISGGTLGGLLNFRDTELDLAENSLGRIAMGVAAAVNDQHRLGQDLAGVLGGDFFRVPAPAAAMVSGTGSATLAVTLSDATALTTSDYRVDYDGANYNVMRLQDGVVTTIAPGGTLDGLTIDFGGGTPAAGDRFLIQPTRAAAANIAVALTDASRIAAAAPIRTAALGSNTGSGAISAGQVDVTYLPAPLAAPLTFSFTIPATLTTTVPASATVAGVTTVYAAGAGIPYVDGMDISVGGASFTLSGSPADGDRFTIGPNTGGKGDNRNANALAELATARLIGGTSTLGGAFGQLISSVGAATREASIQAAAQGQVLVQAQAAHASVSGVNLDEEAANLQRYQQAYQAAGKLMAIASTLFQTILDITG